MRHTQIYRGREKDVGEEGQSQTKTEVERRKDIGHSEINMKMDEPS